MPRPKQRRGNVTTIDFTGVESGGGAAVPDGRYAAKIVEAEEKEGKESGEPYVQITWEITSKKCGGRKIPFDNYSCQPQALWRLKGMLDAIGEEVPDGSMDIDWDDIIKDEEECIIEVTGKKSDDRYYARVTGIAPLADGGTVDDEDDPPKGRKESATRSRTSSRDDDKEDDAKERGRRERPSRGDKESEERPARRAARRDEGEDRNGKDDDDRDTRRSSGSRKLKRGARVKFRDERGKAQKGTVDDIDGSTATVTSDADEQYEMDTDELTVIED